MADLTGVNDTLPVRLGGVSLTSGLPDNYADVNANAQLLVFDAADGSATGGTAAGSSSLAGGLYNSTPPTLTNGQQAGLQLDSSGRLLVDANITFPYDTNYGTVGATTLRTASQIGNATGGANFGAGATGAQTLRVTANLSDGSGNSISSTAGALNVNATQGTSPWITKDQADGSVNGGTAGSFSLLVGGVYNSTALTLTNGQQASLQLNSLGYLLVAPPILVTPATQNITTQDIASTTTTGANGQNFITGTPTAASTASFAIVNEYSIIVQVTGTWTGTLQIEISMDGGTTWSPNPINQDGTNYVLNAFTGNFTGRANTVGYTNFRVRAIAAITGTATVRITEAVGVNTVYINNPIKITDNAGDIAVISSTGSLHVLESAAGPVTPGTAAGFSDLVGGQYNSTPPTLTTGQQASLQLTSAGALIVSSSGGTFTGTLTNNNAAPAANNVGALIALAEGTLNAARYTTGDQVLLVTDLAGNTNVDLQYYLGAAVSKTNPIATTISDGTNVITAAISAYGTAPTGTEVMGVNAYITNIPTVNQGTSPWIVKDVADGSVTGGTAGTFSLLTGGVYNTTLPTLTNGQQASLQLDSTGHLLVDATAANTIATGALGALNARVSVSMAGQSSAGMQLAAGTLIGTIVPNVSYDNGVTWQATYWQNSATGELFGNFTFASANPAEGHFIIVAPGATNVSVVVTAYTSGTANVTISATNVTGKPTLFDGLTGNPPPPTIVQVGGVVSTAAPSLANGNLNPFSLTLAGAIRVDGSATTQPVSVASLPLPTGAATSANQATEITSLQTIDNMIGPVTPGAVATGSALMGGQYNTTLPTLTNTEQSAIQLDSSGRILVTQNPITKGTQGTDGVTVQELKDAGRNQTNYFMATQIVTTATDALQSLTGYKGGAAVGATTTPAVVTTGKTYRLMSITITYVAITTAGTAQFTLRANTGGVVAIGSPAVASWSIGGAAATAGVSQTQTIDFPDGMEFAAGTGIGISMVGRGATGTAAAVGYGQVTIFGYEY